MYFKQVTWSPVEVEYLKNNYQTIELDQLTIALSKSRSAVQKMIKHIKAGTEADTKTRKSQSKVGKASDIDMFMRSGWERNFYRWLHTDLSPWQFVKYEPKEFPFTDWYPPKGSALSYTPDFEVKDKVTGATIYIEIKGMLRPQDKTKLKRFMRHYPSEAMCTYVIAEKDSIVSEVAGLGYSTKKWQSIESDSTNVPNWEG